MSLFYSCSWWNGLQCFFCAGGCSSRSGTRGTLYFFTNILRCVGVVHLLRHSEGSTWLALIEVRQVHIASNWFSLKPQELQITETSPPPTPPEKREEIAYEVWTLLIIRSLLAVVRGDSKKFRERGKNHLSTPGPIPHPPPHNFPEILLTRI